MLQLNQMIRNVKIKQVQPYLKIECYSYLSFYQKTAGHYKLWNPLCFTKTQ